MSDDARIKALEGRVATLEAVIAGFRAVFSPQADVDDAELDGPRGNPAIRKDPTPTYWTGKGYAGKKLSEAPPEYLDAYAKYKEYCAKKTTEKGDPAKMKFAEWDRLDAARARGWAARLRAGWTAPEKPAGGGFGASSGAGSSGGRFGGGSGAGISEMNGTGRNPFAGDATPPPPPSSRPPVSERTRADDIDEERAAIQDEAMDETEMPL